MSRVGRSPISIPDKVTVEFKDRTVFVEGPLGKLNQKINDRNIDVKIENGVITVVRANDEKQSKAMHGLYRILISNMVSGVTTHFSKTLIVNGVGFKCAVAGNKLTMNIGFSHPVEIIAPEGIEIICPQPTEIVVKGISKELVGAIAANIRAKRPVEPYHLYGIRYNTEIMTKKEGKTAGK
ncbi:MAG: 50S ribosomal protein L6 [Firmicutes bacterium]|nr:50S ribosomal protein L6 [Bacillota bacterium]